LISPRRLRLRREFPAETHRLRLRARAALPFTTAALLFLAAGCDKALDNTGTWQQPTPRVVANPSYPSCTTSQDCLWGQRCDTTAGTCAADATGLAPDFTLPDDNENSETYRQDVTLSKQRGLVTVLYFGLSTCSVCWRQTYMLQNLLERLAAEGVPNVMGLVIDHAQGAGSVWAMAQYTRLPILQDPPETTVWNQFAAEKDTFVVIDPNGFVRESWKTLYLYEVPADLARLEAAIRDAAK
jgi:peroxiredoxin